MTAFFQSRVLLIYSVGYGLGKLASVVLTLDSLNEIVAKSVFKLSLVYAKFFLSFPIENQL